MFEIFQDKAGEYRFRLKAKNGEIILASQGYKQKSGCQNGIRSVIENSKNEDNFAIKESGNGKRMFNLIAQNGQIVGTSQMYTSESGLKNGIKSVMANAAEGNIKEVENR